MKVSLLAALLLTCIFAVAQENDDSPTTNAKAVYAELGGPGLASFNYDMRFQKRNDGLGFRIGAGGFKIDNVGVIFVPLGLNYLLGKSGKNYFELGAGATYVNASEDFNSEPSDFRETFGWLNFGYRYQPDETGFVFRAAINPVFGSGFFMPYYGGVAFGYKF